MHSQSKKANATPNRRKSVSLRLPGNSVDLTIADLEIFKNLQLYVDLGEHEKETTRKMRKLARAFGAAVLMPFTPDVHCVVTSPENGEVISLANTNSIPCVNVRWILDSVSKRVLMPMEEYLVSPTQVSIGFAGTREKLIQHSPRRLSTAPSPMAKTPAIAHRKPHAEAILVTPTFNQSVNNHSHSKASPVIPEVFKENQANIENQPQSSRHFIKEKTLGERIQALLGSSKADSLTTREDTRLKPPCPPIATSTPNDNSITQPSTRHHFDLPVPQIQTPVADSGSKKRRTLKTKTDYKMDFSRRSLKSVSKRRHTMNKVDLENPLSYLEFVEKKIKRALDL